MSRRIKLLMGVVVIVMAAAAIVSATALATVSGPITGWPGTHGSLSGTTTCSPVTLTSTDDKNGYGALDFGSTGGTFAQMGDGGSFTYLQGAGGGGAPRLSVFLANGDLWYVYLYSFNGAPSTPSFEDATNNPNHYVTWSDAMAVDGSQLVTDAILVVDAGWSQQGGTQSIQVNGVTPTNCGPGGVVIPQVNDMFLCYSTFQTDSGKVVTIDKAKILLASKTDHYFLPNAVLGNDPSLANIGPYHLQCNAPGTLTGEFLGNDQNGQPELITAAQALAGSMGGSPEWYPVKK